MALFVFGADSVTTGIRANLGASGSVYIAKGVNVASTDNYRTILGTGSNHRVENYGNIFAIGISVDLTSGSPGQSDNRLVNGEDGLIRAYGNLNAAGVMIGGDAARVDNGGQIVSDGYGLLIGGLDLSTQSVVNNTGRILGDLSGITRFSSATEKLVINNTGLIKGGSTAFDSSASTAAVDIVTNKGSMVGDVLLGGGNDTYDGRSGKISGKVYGQDGADKLLGGAGAETLNGGTSNDTISGGSGNDRIEGGAGADTLTGGAGKDVFVFRLATDSTRAASGRDTTTDFSHTQGDRIDLRAIDASTKVGGDQSFRFIDTQKFHKVAGELRYEKNGGDTYIHGDLNGDAVADFSIRLLPEISLKASDFLL